MEVTCKKEARIIADFNRGKITAKRAEKMIARLAVRKTRHTQNETR